MARPSTTLGVPRGAPLAVIKTRWRTLVAEGHSDKEKDPVKKRVADARFRELRAAYDRLLVGDDNDLEPAVRGVDWTIVQAVEWLAALRGERIDMRTPDGLTITVKLPENAHTGQVLRFSGRGAPGEPPGDLFVQLLVLSDPDYRHSRADPFTLERLLRITWLSAWSGATVEVDTPWGPTWIDLRARTHDGQVYEIPAHGVRKAERWGPLRLTVILDAPPAPSHLTEETRTALEAALSAAYEEGAKKVGGG